MHIAKVELARFVLVSLGHHAATDAEGEAVKELGIRNEGE